MSTLSRRGFLTSVFPERRRAAMHTGQDSAFHRQDSGFHVGYREELDVQPGAGQAPCWVPIGRLADFPPGSVVRVNDHKQLLRSLPEGLMAQDATESAADLVRPLRLEQNGQVYLNATGRWEAGTVLSVMTGSPICLQEEVT